MQLCGWVRSIAVGRRTYHVPETTIDNLDWSVQTLKFGGGIGDTGVNLCACAWKVCYGETALRVLYVLVSVRYAHALLLCIRNFALCFRARNLVVSGSVTMMFVGVSQGHKTISLKRGAYLILHHTCQT